MSFREDFLEALRRVKKDFFRDSDDTGATEQPAEEASPAPIDVVVQRLDREPQQPPQSIPQDEEATEPIIPPVTAASPPQDAPPERSEVFQEFERPSPGGGNFERHSDRGSAPFPGAEPGDTRFDGFQERDLGLSRAQTYHQEQNSRQSYQSSASTPPPSPAFDEREDAFDGRQVYDFEPDDLYSDDRTVISRNTVIRGALQTEDSIRMLGQILGDIECKSNILVAGKVKGNTTAANAYVVDAQIDGNMMCADSINVTNDAWILGNLRAQQAEIAGKIKGNIETRHTVSIDSTSSIIGNISTDELEIKRGAFVNGQIIMYSPSRDVMDRFDRIQD